MKKLAPFLLMLFLAACHPIRGFLESEFKLSPESRLPSWYPELPEGIERDQVEITLEYWSSPFDVDDAVFTVKKGIWTLYKETGRSEWHPKYWAWAQKDWPARSRPSFHLLTIDGKTEVVGHFVKGSIFEFSSETEVEKVVGASP
jgi:hypothetical protein